MSRPVDLSPAIAAEIARLRAALDAIPALAEPEQLERAVHAARRSIKVLRAALRLLGPAKADPHRKEIDAQLRELAGSLSQTRDLHVAAETVLSLRQRLKSDAETASKRRKALRQRLAALASQWGDRASAVERSRRLRADAPALEVIETRLLGLGFARDSDALAEQAARTYGKARRSLRSALLSDDDEELHVARIVLVRHQLQTGLLRPIAGGGKARHKDLGRLRELLGEHHDLSVAETLAGETPHDAQLGLDLARLVGRRQGKIVERCRPLVDALFGESRASFEEKLAARLAAPRRPADNGDG
jgi:CHAD domain-containing protein